MDIINDITRVARESKQIIQQQQEEIEKLRIENEAYKRAFSNQGNVQVVKGSGIGKYFDDGILTVRVASLYPDEEAYGAPHGTPWYHVKLELNAKYVHAEKEIDVTL